MKAWQEVTPGAANLADVRRRAARGVVGIAMAAALACAGCGGKKAAGTRSPTTSSTAPVETTTTTVGVDQVPAVITVEYAQQVMNALDKLEGDTARVFFAAKGPTPEWRDRLMTLYDSGGFDDAEASFGRIAAHNFDVYRATPGDPVTTVTAVADSSPTCMVLQGTRDFSTWLKTPPPEETLTGILVLGTKRRERDPQSLNPTVWAIRADGDPAPGVDPSRGCH